MENLVSLGKEIFIIFVIMCIIFIFQFSEKIERAETFGNLHRSISQNAKLGETFRDENPLSEIEKRKIEMLKNFKLYQDYIIPGNPVFEDDSKNNFQERVNRKYEKFM